MTLTTSGKWASQIEAMLAPYAEDAVRCSWCNAVIPTKGKRKVFFCSQSHRQLDYLKRKKEGPTK